MVITKKGGNRFSASTVTEGYAEWGKPGEKGILFYCTNAYIHMPYPEIESIELEDGTIMERRLPPAPDENEKS